MDNGEVKGSQCSKSGLRFSEADVPLSDVFIPV